MPPLNLFRLPPKFQRRRRRSRMATLITLVLTLTLLITPFYVIYKPPAILIRYLAWKYPKVLWHVPLPSDRKFVALSLDDSPSAYTAEIAAVLKANDAHATFFVIGSQVASRAEILSDLVKDGHELGNHAMYDEPSRSLPSSELQKQLKSVEQSIGDAYTIIGKDRPETRWFRPGSGFFSKRMVKVAEELGLKVALGSVYPHDPQMSSPWLNARHVLSMVRPGSIIINHDRRPWTMEGLKRILPDLKRTGYEIVTITRLVEEGQNVAMGLQAGKAGMSEGSLGPASRGSEKKEE